MMLAKESIHLTSLNHSLKIQQIKTEHMSKL